MVTQAMLLFLCSQVFLLLTLQLSVTIAIVAVFTYEEDVIVFVQNNVWLYHISFAIYFISLIIVGACAEFERKLPWNLIALVGTGSCPAEGGLGRTTAALRC